MIHADLQNRHYVSWREFLSESEEWDADRIARHQLAELKRVITDAYGRTAAYRQLFDAAGISPLDIASLDDFRKLPFVTKEMIRDDLEGFSVDLPDRDYTATSGSTGIPLGIYRDPVSFAKELASKAHQYARLGWKEGDGQFCLRGYQVEAQDGIEFLPRFNELRCSSYHLVPEYMEQYLRTAWEYGPDWIKCYPSTGFVFAQFLQDTDRRFPPVRGVLCASEKLHDFQRKLLSEIFGARVFSHYGHYEMAALAGYCEREDVYHVLPQYGYVELIDEDGHPVMEPGQRGEIVATSFINGATLFVRYRTQDYAVLKGWGCVSCGRPYQVWERIEGRLQEFLVTGSGQYIPLTGMRFPDRIFDHIKQFQFAQSEGGRVTFRFVPRESCDDAVVLDMQRGLIEGLGHSFKVEMRPVKEIPRTQRAKQRLLVREERWKA